MSRPSRSRGGVLAAIAIASSLASIAACGGKVVVDGVAAGRGGSDDLLDEGGAAVAPSSSDASTTSVGGAGPVGPGPSGPGASPVGTGGVGGTPPPPSIPHLVEIPLGEALEDEVFSVVTDARTVSLTFSANAQQPFDEVGIRSLVAPTNEAVIADFLLAGGPEAEAVWYGSVAASVPETESPASMPVAPGTWSVSVGSPGFGALSPTTLTAYVRQTVDGQFHGGALDVNVFAGGAVDTQYLVDAVVGAYAGYAGGLEIGAVTVYAAPPSFDVVESFYGFFEALELTGGATARPALNLVATASFEGDLYGIAGIASGIPGNGMIHGSHSSGLVFAPNYDFASDTSTLQHETGHVSGLFHTTEISGGLFDGLGDTPTCSNVDALLYDCPDAGNAMFPYALDVPTAFSPLQTRVLQGSTMYRGVVEPGGAPGAPEIAAPKSGGASSAVGGASAPLVELAVVRPTAADVTRVRARLAASVAAAASPARTAWRAHLPAHVAASLGGARCEHAPLYGAPGSPLAARFAGVEPARFLDVARDAAAPAFVRERALDAVGRAAASPSAELEAMALDESLDPRVRAGALRGLSHASPAAARALATRISAPPRSLLAVVAEHLAR